MKRFSVFFRFKGFLRLVIDVFGLEVNKCDLSSGPTLSNQIEVLRGTHKCHNDTTKVKENLFLTHSYHILP
jgi:hypothetical protein